MPADVAAIQVHPLQHHKLLLSHILDHSPSALTWVKRQAVPVGVAAVQVHSALPPRFNHLSSPGFIVYDFTISITVYSPSTLIWGMMQVVLVDVAKAQVHPAQPPDPTDEGCQ